MQKKKSVIIVGAGIAGLSAGVYAARSGFDVTIVEKHNIPGGLSSAWKRSGYFFEGGMHWLTGSSEKLKLNKVWKQVGALKENNPIYMRDPFYTYIKGDKRIYFYRDLNKFCENLLLVSPQDKKNIKRLKRDVKSIMNLHMVVTDLPFLKIKKRIGFNPMEFLKMIPVLFAYPRLNSIPCEKYISRFIDKDVRHLLSCIIGYNYNALSMIYTIASFASGDCGFPIGGSIRLAKNMADTFEALGGKILYKTEVTKVCFEKKEVTGVFAGEKFLPSDAVIVTEDTRTAIDTLFEKPLSERWANKMRKKVIPEQTMFVCLGIKADLKNYPKGIVFGLDESFEFAGLKFNEFRINNYAEYENYSPEGCSTLTCLLIGDSYDFWKNCRQNGIYKEQKNLLAQKFISQLEKKMPEIIGKVEVIDVATPLTYERYTNSYCGSWMSIWKTNGSFDNYPFKSNEIKGLYFAGQRTGMPGGLPIAVCSGRSSIQHLCRDSGFTFVAED